MILKGLVTTDIGQRINSLLYILQWYDGAVLYLTFQQKGVLTPEQRKSLDRVHKSRLQGQGTTFNDEKETAYRTAIKILEKLMEKVLQPAKIDQYYQILENRKPKLEKKTENWLQKYGSTVQMLKQALKPKNVNGEEIEISIGPVQEEVQKDAELRRFVLRPDVAKQLHRKRLREGLLTTVMDPLVIEELARLSAMEKEIGPDQNWTGRWLSGGLKQTKAILEMMRNLITYARAPEAPKRLVKIAPAQVPVNGQAAAQTQKPRVARPGFGGARTGPKLAGMFVQGSDIAKLYETLIDGQPHAKDDLQKMISANLMGRLRVIESKARDRGLGWRVQVTNGQVTLHVPVQQTQTGGQP